MATMEYGVQHIVSSSQQLSMFESDEIVNVILYE